MILLIAASAVAQDWVKVFQTPVPSSCGFFFNADLGFIGTGLYTNNGSAAQIYFTTDGGKSWTRSLMTNMNISGQVTDIWFSDRQHGWALIKQNNESGWSGVYRTVDGGVSWDLWYQANFGVAIRETKNGVFFTDRFQGIRRSTDGGNTFPIVAPSFGVLGMDFQDDKIGYASGEGGAQAPHFITVDGGITWIVNPVPREAWTPFADPFSKQIFLSSEHDNNQPPSESAILTSLDTGKSFLVRKRFRSDGISGGMAGFRGCRSVVYVQGQWIDSPGVVHGILRSTDAGANWVNVGGPSNNSDTRFVVTGYGAVVYAFDIQGNVWKTTTGGDGKLTGSALPVMTAEQIPKRDTISSPLCDSADFRIRLTYSDCDSLFLSHVYFLDDFAGELSQVSQQKYFGKNGSLADTLIIRYKPKYISAQDERVRLRIRHADGAFEDTILSFAFHATPAKDRPVIVEGGIDKKMDFGSRTICGEDTVRVVTITNAGCAEMQVNDLFTSGAPFTLESAFQPFKLAPGLSRKFLLRFKPGVVGNVAGSFTIITPSTTDSILLTGIGVEGARGLVLSQPTITASACDSVDAEITLHNISCSAIDLDSIRVLPPFTLPFSVSGMIGSDSIIRFKVRLVPQVPGPVTRELQVYSNISGIRFDTIFFINGTVTDGAPDAALSTSLLDFGNVSTCSFRDLTIYVRSTGCDTVTINSTSLDNTASGYSTIRSITNVDLPPSKKDSIVIRFTPPSVGAFTTTLRVQTSAGERTVTLQGNGTNDPGTLAISATPLGTVLTCSDTTFVITISNTTCDSLIFDSLAISGNATTDYTIDASGFIALGIGAIKDLIGTFAPQAGGLRDATAHFYFHDLAGGLKEVSIALAGIGSAPSPLRVKLPASSIATVAGKTIAIPIEVTAQNVVGVNDVRISLSCNTDLAEPLNFSLSSTSAVVTIENMSKSGCDIHLIYSAPEIFALGKLGEIQCRTYITDSFMTTIGLKAISATSSASSTVCTPAEVEFDSTVITVDPQCGDSILSHQIAGDLAIARIVSVNPNPTDGKVEIGLYYPGGFEETCTLEVYDARGMRIDEQNIPISAKEKKDHITLDLQGASGARYIRLVSSKGMSTAKVFLAK